MNLFFNIALFYSSFVLVFLPLFGCAFISCAAVDQSISVSAIIHAEPLSTAYAFFGAIFLLSVLYFQTTKKNLTRYSLAFIASKLLGVPLIIPLNSVKSNWYHIAFAGAGFTFEFLLLCTVLYECQICKIRPRGTRVLGYCALIYFLGVLAGACVFLPNINKMYQTYALIAAEYILGFALAISAKTMDMYSL